MKTSSLKTRDIALYGILTAIIIIMGFTPLGFLKVGTIEITFIMIPVAIGAIMLGPVGGAVLGAVFGLASFFQCFGVSLFGTALFAINPFFTAIICIVPRVLMGFLSGLIFISIKKKHEKGLSSYLIATLSAAVLNTIFFVGFLLLFFGSSDYIQSFGENIIAIIGALVTLNAIIEIIVCVIVGSGVAKALSYILDKRSAK